MILQVDGASLFLHEWCKQGNNLLSWPHHSSDLAPCDFFLWGFVRLYIPLDANIHPATLWLHNVCSTGYYSEGAMQCLECVWFMGSVLCDLGYTHWRTVDLYFTQEILDSCYCWWCMATPCKRKINVLYTFETELYLYTNSDIFIIPYANQQVSNFLAHGTV